MPSKRRSTRTLKAPERFDSGTPQATTPRKRSKQAANARSSAISTPVAATNKRQKTRNGATAVTAASKRKDLDEDSDEEEEESQSDNSDRGSEQDEEESAVSETSDEEDQDETSDFEEKAQSTLNKTPRKTQRNAKQQPKQRQGRQQQSLGARKAKARAIANVEAQPAGQNDSHLLAAILDDKVALAQVAMDWIDSYREEADAAVCELLNFIFKLTGCPSKIKEDVVYEAESVPAVLAELQAQSIAALKSRGASATFSGVEINSGEDLLMGKSKEYRKFRKNALQFISKLVVDGQHHLVFDEINEENSLSAFVEVLLQWLVSMASSSYRPFRHVAALVTLAIQSALVSIRAHISVEQQTVHRQLEAETRRESARSRRSANKESAKLGQLRDRVATLTEHDELAETAFKAFYDTAFIYRYRDVHAIIRAECLVPLATWCRAYPASYLDTEYLRYLGWALNDKDARVREAALSAIAGPLLTGKPTSITQGNVGSGVGALDGIGIASEESVSEGLRPFVARFLPRIVQVAAGDVDTKVQVAALKLVSLLAKHSYLDPSANIGDIRFAKKPARSSRDAKDSKSRQDKQAKKRRDRARSTYSHSLSQQMLEESGSEEESDEDAEVGAGADETTEHNLEPGVLNIQALYSEDEDGSDDSASHALPCPRNSVMRYLSPLVAHTHATVRSAASELVAWWVKEEWVSSARIAVLGVDTVLDGDAGSLGGSAIGAGDDGDDGETSDGADIEGDADASISDILESAARRNRAKKWLLYKSLGAFLWRLAHMDRASAIGTSTAGENNAADAESKQTWILEQAASCIEEMWSASALSTGFSLSGEDSAPTLAGSTIAGIKPTALDAELDASVSTDQGTVLPRCVAAAQTLWHKIPELSDLDTLLAFLTWDHSVHASASRSSSTAQKLFALAPGEETALVQAYAVWMLERKKAIADKGKRTRHKKDKSDLEEELASLSKLWQSRYVPLLVRNIDSPTKLLPLVFLAAEALDLQAMFDAHQTDVLQDIVKNVSLVLERYGGDVPLARLATSFLERVDASRVLPEALETIEERADQSDRSPDAAIEQLYSLLDATARPSGPQFVPEKAAIAALDTAYYFLLWRALRFDKLLNQHTAHPYLAAEDTEQPPYWKRASSFARLLRRDRDKLVGLCLELADPSASSHRRLRELSFAILGRVFKLFNGSLTRPQNASTDSAGARHALDLRRSLLMQNGQSLLQKLTEFFERKLADWACLVTYLSRPEPASGDETENDAADSAVGEALPTHLALEAPWYRDAPSSWSIAYSRFCALAALWAQWISDSLVPVSQLSRLAAHTGMLGLEPLEKQRVERGLDSSDHTGDPAAKAAPKRKAGFVSLSAFDHIVQAAVDGLKPGLVLQSTRDAVMDAYMKAMQASFEMYLAPASRTAPQTDPVNVATLARFIASALKTAFAQQPNAPATPARGRRGGADGSALVLAPAVIGGAWAKHHLRAVDYGLSHVIPAPLLAEDRAVATNVLDDDGEVAGDGQGDAEISHEAASAEEWETRAAPWFAALSQTVSGVLRPRHAETLNEHLEGLLKRLALSKPSISASNEDGGEGEGEGEGDGGEADELSKRPPAEDAEHALAAIAPYQRALDKELARLGAIKARMAEVRAAEASTIVEPSSPTPAAPGSNQSPLLGTAEADMDVDE
ncbi:cohesin complex subunit [Dipsacomyces acuminosporus]|nr:cohesin complex subunit [Dipsacomyces acuminosporus]